MSVYYVRKKKSFLNILGAISVYFVNILFTLITQGIIIKILGIEYNGINGLFTNVITMLSIAELGIGTTIIYKLYEPVSQQNYNKINAWLKFYKICYRWIAFSVLIFGLMLIPFIPLIVGKISISENIICLYLIYLIDCVCSYIMTYKRSLLYADQKNYIINFVHVAYIIFMNITQILILYFTKNYLIYLFVKIIYRLIENIVLTSLVNKQYPYVLNNSESLSKEEKKDIFIRIKAIFLQKISFVINKGIDNIIISIFLGIHMVGYYTNYNTMVLALSNIVYQIISSMMASVGNLLTEKNINNNYYFYKRINMMNSFLTGLFVVLLISCASQFIEIWIGKQYILSESILISFCIYLYSDSIRRSITIFKDAAGICKEDKYMYVIMAIINLVASIVLCKLFGVSGVILGTAISYLFLIIYSYPKYIYIPLFNKKYSNYLKDNINYIFLIILSSVSCFILKRLLFINNPLIGLCLYSLISIFVFVFLFILFFHRTEEFQYFLLLFKKVIFKVIRRTK